MSTRLLLVVTAALSIGAAVIHAIVTPEHFKEWWGYGTFFLIVTIAQAAFGLLMLALARRNGNKRASTASLLRLLCLAGIVGNALIIGMWAWTRTVGIPIFGPHAGEVEEITGIDVLSKVIELALIFCLIWLIRQMHPSASNARSAV